MGILSKPLAKTQVGLYQQESQLEMVWFDDHQSPKYVCTEKEQGKDVLFQQLQADFGLKNRQIQFIACISPHHVWTKTFILPQSLNHQECLQQCHFILAKELPIPLTELWFDYQSMPLKQGCRLDIYAIRQTIAKEFLLQYQPFELNTLDVASNAISRAFSYLMGKSLENTLLIYEDEQLCLAQCERGQQRQLLQFQGEKTQENLTALWTQFQRRFPDNIEQIYVYQTTPTAILAHWQRLETPLPLIALGNALWQQEFYEKQPHFKVDLE